MREILDDRIAGVTFKMVEFEPECRTLITLSGNRSRKDRSYVALPYVQLTHVPFDCIAEDRMSVPTKSIGRWTPGVMGQQSRGLIYMTFTNEPVENPFEDALYFPPLPHLQHRGYICGGDFNCSSFDKIVERVWFSSWNFNYTGYDGITYLARTKLKTIENWTWLTKINPNFLIEEPIKWPMKTSLPFQEQSFYSEKYPFKPYG